MPISGYVSNKFVSYQIRAVSHMTPIFKSLLTSSVVENTPSRQSKNNDEQRST